VIWLMTGSTVLSNSVAGPFNPGPSWQIRIPATSTVTAGPASCGQNDDAARDLATHVLSASVAGSFNPGADWHVI
jgi:hypothetical protein